MPPRRTGSTEPNVIDFAKIFWSMLDEPTKADLKQKGLGLLHMWAGVPSPTYTTGNAAPPPPATPQPPPPDARAVDAAMLGVLPTASIAEIKRAYKRRARELHPDVGGDPAAWRALDAAYKRALKWNP